MTWDYEQKTVSDRFLRENLIAHYKLNEDAANTTVVDSAGIQSTATTSRNTNAMNRLEFAHYKLDDSAASTAVIDSVGYSNGTATTNTVNLATTGKVGGAFGPFGATAESATGAHRVAVDIDGIKGFSVWVKRDAGMVDKAGVILRGEIAGNATHVFDLGHRSTNNWYIFVDGTLRNITTAVTGEWIHLLGNYDGTTWKIYANDALALEVTVSGTYKVTSIGNRVNDLARPFMGDVDDVRLFKTQTTEADRAFIYNSGSGVSASRYFTAKLTYAFNFNGVADYINIPHHASQLLTDGFTISAWIKPDTIGETNGRIVDKSTNVSVAGGFAFGLNTNNQTYVRVNEGGAISSASGSVVYGDGLWYHVLATVAADATVTHYINGVQSGTPGTTGALSGITTTNDLRIGNRSGATDRAFDGGIDDVRIYKGVLSSPYRNFLYYNGRGTEENTIWTNISKS